MTDLINPGTHKQSYSPADPEQHRALGALPLSLHGRSRVIMGLNPDARELEGPLRSLLEQGVHKLPEFRRSRHAVVYRLERADLPFPLFIKQFNLRNRWDYLKLLFRSSRAWRTLRANAVVERQGFQVEPVLGWAEYSRYGFVWRSFLITREIPTAHEAHHLLSRPELGHPRGSPQRYRFIEELGKEVGAWHRAGLHHGDLRLSNILVQCPQDHYHFFWMDNERTRRFACLPNGLRVHNLSQLISDRNALSRSDILRFWHGYQQTSGFTPRNKKSFARRIIRRTRRKWKRKERRNNRRVA